MASANMPIRPIHPLRRSCQLLDFLQNNSIAALSWVTCSRVRSRDWRGALDKKAWQCSDVAHQPGRRGRRSPLLLLSFPSCPHLFHLVCPPTDRFDSTEKDFSFHRDPPPPSSSPRNIPATHCSSPPLSANYRDRNLIAGYISPELAGVRLSSPSNLSPLPTPQIYNLPLTYITKPTPRARRTRPHPQCPPPLTATVAFPAPR